MWESASSGEKLTKIYFFNDTSVAYSPIHTHTHKFDWIVSLTLDPSNRSRTPTTDSLIVEPNCICWTYTCHRNWKWRDPLTFISLIICWNSVPMTPPSRSKLITSILLYMFALGLLHFTTTSNFCIQSNFLYYQLLCALRPLSFSLQMSVDKFSVLILHSIQLFVCLYDCFVSCWIVEYKIAASVYAGRSRIYRICENWQKKNWEISLVDCN